MTDATPNPGLPARLALLGIIALGLTVRLWTIGNGIPHTVAVDEPEIMHRVVDMMKSGDFNPHFFDYGGLTIYFHTAVASVRFAVGALTAESGYHSLEGVWEGSFYLWAREATALIGTLIIYVVYRTGLRWGLRTALVAALFAAIHPNLVLESHKALTDTPLTFLVALTMLVAIIAAEDGRLRWFLLAGLTAGLATAVKYNGALVVLMPLTVAALSTHVQLRAAAILVTVIGAAGAFLAGAPYSVLDLPAFLQAFASLAKSYSQSRPPLDVADTYMTYVRNSLSFGFGGWSNYLGWPALLLSLYGLVMLLVRAPARAGRPATLALGIFGGAYLWLITHQSLVYMRYALPLLPLLCLGLGMAVSVLTERVRQRVTNPRMKLAALILLALPMFPPLWQAFFFNWDRRKTGTEEIAARWLERNIAPQDPVMMETPVIRLPPPFKWDNTHRLIHQSLQRTRIKASNTWWPRRNGSTSPGGRLVHATPSLTSNCSKRRRSCTSIPATEQNPGPTLTILKVPPK